MSTSVLDWPTRLTGSDHAAPARRSVSLDWAIALTSVWMIGGAWLDAWAHDNVPYLETFFTPWHGVLYSGLLATVVALVVAVVSGRAAGRPWRGVLPRGCGLSLAGALIFAAGGVGDMIWHQLFGIESDFEALISPTHLVLAVGAVLIASGPLRAAWSDPQQVARRDLSAWLPPLLSLTTILSALTFFSDYASPFTRPWLLGSRLLMTPDPVHGHVPGALPSETELGPGVAGVRRTAGLLTPGARRHRGSHVDDPRLGRSDLPGGCRRPADVLPGGVSIRA
jgi:hypothetical protein